MKTFESKKEFDEFVKEIAEHTSEKYHTIVFEDGDVSHVTGSFEARKPVWVDIDGKIGAEALRKTLCQAYEDEDGIPSLPYPNAQKDF